MRSAGIEPASHPWQGRILPLNYDRMSFNSVVPMSFLNFIKSGRPKVNKNCSDMLTKIHSPDQSGVNHIGFTPTIYPTWDMVPGEGLEPTLLAELDLKSSASTNSAIRACIRYNMRRFTEQYKYGTLVICISSTRKGKHRGGRMKKLILTVLMRQ